MPTKLKSTGVEFPDSTTQTTEGVTSVTAGNALTGGGSGNSVTINHADTSTQSSVSNSGSDVIQSVTLDDFGHVTGLSSTTISATPTTAQVLSATAGASDGAVGTYAFLRRYTDSGYFGPGATLSGSNLGFNNADGVGTDNTDMSRATPSGTWRIMGRSRGQDTGSPRGNTTTLWLRIS